MKLNISPDVILKKKQKTKKGSDLLWIINTIKK